MPIEEVVRIAKQIAEAVEAAHEKGVVHRDLKPANVNITPDGNIKVLDFGLAKALTGDPMSGDSLDQDLSLSPTMTKAMTGMGMLLGTAGYMSPEQARGKPVDRRADIWAFGCVLYEMLTGQRLFTGETATDVIGAVVHKEPDLDELSSKVPTRIRLLLERCLQKDSSRRLQSIGDARIALQEWLENPEEPAVEAASTRPGWLPWAAAAVAGLIGLGLGSFFLGSNEQEPPLVQRFAVELAEEPLFGAGAPLRFPRRMAAISPTRRRSTGAVRCTCVLSINSRVCRWPPDSPASGRTTPSSPPIANGWPSSPSPSSRKCR